MRVIERLETLAAVLPEDAVIQLPMDVLRRWLEEDGLVPPAPPVAPAAPAPAVMADLTVSQVAQALSRAESTVRNWCAAGEFPGAYRLHGKEWRIPPDSLRRFQYAQQPTPRREEPRSARELARAWADL